MHCVESYTILYATLKILRWRILPSQNKAAYYTRSHIRGDLWTGSFLYSSKYDLIYLHGFLWGYLVVFKILTRSEVVASLCRSGMYNTYELTSAVWLSHTSSVWPWLGVSKSKFVWYICQRLTSLAPTYEESEWAQWGKNLKKASHLSACDVTRVVSLGTNNLSIRV